MSFWGIFSAKKLKGTCLICGKCCRNIILVHRGKILSDISQFDELVSVDPFYNNLTPHHFDEDDHCLYFECSKLGDDNRCMIYKKRHQICKSYPSEKMIKKGGNLLEGCGYQPPTPDFQSILEDELKKKKQ